MEINIQYIQYKINALKGGGFMFSTIIYTLLQGITYNILLPIFALIMNWGDFMAFKIFITIAVVSLICETIWDYH